MPKRGGSKGRKKPSLYSLSRPEDIDFDAYFNEMRLDSHHAVAILSTSLLQHSIAQLIMRKLGDLGDDKLELLYDRDGPLSSLYSTTILAFAMGLMDQETFDDVNTIRRIRNAFAHAPVGLTFSHPLVAAECDKLKSEKHPSLNVGNEYLTSNLLKFMILCHSISLRYSNAHAREIQRQVKSLKARLRRMNKKQATLTARLRS